MEIFLKELTVYLICFIELFTIVLLFVKDCPHRVNFVKRFSILIAVGIVIQFPIAALRLVENSAILSTVKFSLSAAPIFLFLYCYKINIKSLLFDILVSSAVRQWSNIILNIVLIFHPQLPFYAQRLLNIAGFAVMLFPVYFLFIKSFVRPSEIVLEWLSLISAMVLYGFIEAMPALVFQIYQGVAVQIVVSVVRIIAEIFIFWIYLYICKKSRQKSEQLMSEALLAKERVQYENLKRNMEGLKAQLHDIKYLLRSAKASADAAEIERIKGLLNNFENGYNTGNDALDIILTDAHNKFTENEIEFSCMVANIPAGIIENFDLFSLLGNAFDNAVEYLLKCEKEKRYVGFVAKTVNSNFCFFEITNYYEGKEDVFIGMPTSKSDKSLHGFGIKNMNRIVEKYGGDFSVGTREGEFYVSIIIPLK